MIRSFQARECLVRSPPLAFCSLWVSQTARALADNCLRMFVVLHLGSFGSQAMDAAWHQVTPFFIGPFILLAPFNGALSNSRSKRAVLVGSATFCLGVAGFAALVLGLQTNVPWLWCLVVGGNALGAAIYSPTRYALLPAAAHDCRISLSRVMAWIEMGGAAAIVAGLVLGWHLSGVPWGRALEVLGLNSAYPDLGEQLQSNGVLLAPIAVALLNLLALVTALPVRFDSDVRRPEPIGQAVRGFFRDGQRILRDREARATLFGLASFMAIVVGGAGAALAFTMRPDSQGNWAALPQAMICISIGSALGSLLTATQRDLRRSLGWVPLGATGLLAALAWGAVADKLNWPCFWMGFSAGLVNVPLRAGYQNAVPADARGNGMAIMNVANYSATALLAVVFFGLAHSGWITPAGQLGLLAGLAGVGAVVSFGLLKRALFDSFLESLLAPFYRVRGYGPGLESIPRRGPVLVIANHTAWFDPLWLGKVLPRSLTPMMTSDYYDLPVVSWVMRHIIGAIRVQASRFRREAPELQEGIAALDQGKCLVIFPEGALKRREDQVLRQFGQGVWRILRERPETPVVVCWTEGGWGSFTSYYQGRPTKNKSLDWWRPITIAVEDPRLIDPEILEDQRATRQHLMQLCVQARRHLGLEPLKLAFEREEAGT